MDQVPRIRVELPALDPATGEGRPGVALVTIDRPAVLNAIDLATITELVRTLEELDADPACRAIVITGAGERAFAAGADIAEMAAMTGESIRATDPFAVWDRIGAIVTPLIAAVRGFALGGGAELAWACDLIVAADDATFGQPEVKLGIIPGAGGTQRLARAAGKARAMEIVLTGRRVPAAEAYALGLVSRLVPAGEVVASALALARDIAANAPLAVAAAQRVIDLAEELPLADGLAAERAAFYDLFDTDDQTEGMRAFLEKRPPAWRGR
ncbi:MAG: enoyl-CoA hydratase-related protein [Chloroflexota bacterium]